MNLPPTTRHLARAAITLGATLALTACGGDNNESNNNGPAPVPTNNDNNNNGTTNNTSNNNPNGSTNNTSNNNPNGSTNNTSNNNPNGTSNSNSGNSGNSNSGNSNSGNGDVCLNIADLGEIDPTMGSMTIQGDTTDASLESGYATACGFGPAPERGFLLKAQSPMRVKATFTSSSTSFVLDILKGDCDASEGLLCSTSPDVTFAADAGESFILLAEPQNNARGTFEIELEFEPLACLPIGGISCEGEDIARCVQGGTAVETYSCAEPCAMDACGGDLCENAAEVTSFPYRFEGSTDAYFDNFNMDQPNNCYFPDNELINSMMAPEPVPLPTVGEDAMFWVRGLTAGQKLTVDASSEIGDTADSAIFVLDGCDPMQCHIAIDLADKLDGWEVPSDGDYLVIVDRRSANPTDIVVDIDVE